MASLALYCMRLYFCLLGNLFPSDTKMTYDLALDMDLLHPAVESLLVGTKFFLVISRSKSINWWFLQKHCINRNIWPSPNLAASSCPRMKMKIWKVKWWVCFSVGNGFHPDLTLVWRQNCLPSPQPWSRSTTSTSYSLLISNKNI